MTRSENVADLTTALAKAQAEIKPALRDKIATIKSDKANYTYKYADLADCWEVIRAPLTKNGLSVMQFPHVEGSAVLMETILFHSTGQFIADTISAEVGGYSSLRSLGAAITYLRRFHLSAILGLVSDDDTDAAEEERREKLSEKIEAERSLQMTEFRERMEKAENEADLSTIYKDFYRKVHQWRDADATRELIAIKDENKARLENARVA